MITFSTVLLFLTVCGFVNGQDIRLCPSAGPLHLPPPGCALKKNFVADQNCFTVSVVCKDGQNGGSATGGATGAASASPQEITTAASIDASAQQQNVQKPDAFCPLYNESAPAECEGQRVCTVDNECGITQLCCQDNRCGKKVCKHKLLPCPVEEENFPKDCGIITVVDVKRNCVQRVSSCTNTGATEGATGTPTPTATGTESASSAPGTSAGSPASETPAVTAATAAETGATSASSASPQGITTAASIDASAQQQNVQKPEVFCPLYNESAPAECEGQRVCSADNECGVTQLCCQDNRCGKKICKYKLLPCPVEEGEFPKDCGSVTVVDIKRNCVQTVPICNSTGAAGGAIGTSTPPVASAGAESASSTPGTSGGSPVTEAPAATAVTATVTEAVAVRSDIGGAVAPKNASATEGVGTGKGTITQVPIESSASVQNEALKPQTSCPARNPGARPDPANCDKSRKQCNDDSECAAGELCCADDDCEATICKPARSGGPTPGGSPVGQRTCPPRDPNAQPDPSKCDKSLKKCNDDSECGGELCCADDNCEATVCKAGVTPVVPFRGDTTGSNSRSAASIDAATQQQPAPGSTVVASNATRFCPVRNATVTPSRDNCDKSQRICHDDSECAVTELCCADDDCEMTVCKARLLPCPPDDETAAKPNSNCPIQLIADKARNCVKQTPVCS